MLREPGGSRVAVLYGRSLLKAILEARARITHDVGLWQVLLLPGYPHTGLPGKVALTRLLVRLKRKYEVVYPNRLPVDYRIITRKLVNGGTLVYLRTARGDSYALALFTLAGDAASWARLKAESAIVAGGHADGRPLADAGLAWLGPVEDAV